MLNWFQNKSIAIVGNATSLFSNNFGEEIDSYEIVCRINRGVIIKDRSSQGSKIDVWAYSISRLVEDLFDSVSCKNTIHLSHKHRKTKVAGEKLKQFRPHKYTKFWYPLDKLATLTQSLESTTPSSGLILLDLIFQSNPKNVTLYGFDWKKSPTWYFQESSTEHNWKLEKEYIENTYLNKEHIILK